MLLSMNMMDTLNFEYEWRFHNIEICMNAYKYQKWYDDSFLLIADLWCLR